MFVDIVKIKIRSGNGGNGAVSFHREKYVAAGGPDGGDGGKGGNVVFITDSNMNTLSEFRFKKKFIAMGGENGGSRSMSGKSADDLIIKVPVGTIIKDAVSGRIIKDLSDDEPFIAARGGKGGWGNRHFATATRQIPRFAKNGLSGEEFDFTLELKLIADVGLVGFPNVGKSTLISIVSAARPKIGNFHFTTLTPNLGVVSLHEGNSFVIADIPGLIEGAADGVGLGHEFLRHIERCRLIVHILDASGNEGRSPTEDFEKINAELERYSENLSQKSQIVVANKCDLIYDKEDINTLKKYMEDKKVPLYEISCATREGVDNLINIIYEKLKDIPAIPVFESQAEEQEYTFESDKNNINVTVIDNIYTVEADWLKKTLFSINFDDYEGLQYFQRILKNTGIIEKLEQAGIKEGDTVQMYDMEFDFVY